MMTTYHVACRGGFLLANERDWFRQVDGSRVPIAELSTAHTVPHLGRVVAVRVVPPADGILRCRLCEALVDDLHALGEHGRAAHRRDWAGRPLLKLVDA